LANVLPSSRAVATIEEVVSAELIILSVPDDEIEYVCKSGPWQPGSSIVHCSGALSMDVLASAAERGAKTGSIHPLQTFAGGGDPVARMADIAYALEASDDSLHDMLDTFVHALGGRPQWIRSEDKPLYHASAAMASNYLVALLGDASKLWESFGVSRDQGLHALLPLVKGTMDNLRGIGFPDALTGPIARGDVETVGIHLQALSQSQPDILPSYVAMGKRTIALALEKGTIDPAAAATLRKLLDTAANAEAAS